MRSQNVKYYTCPCCKKRAIVLVDIEDSANFYRDDMGNIQYRCINTKCRTTFSVDMSGNVVTIKLGF